MTHSRQTSRRVLFLITVVAILATACWTGSGQVQDRDDDLAKRAKAADLVLIGHVVDLGEPPTQPPSLAFEPSQEILISVEAVLGGMMDDKEISVGYLPMAMQRGNVVLKGRQPYLDPSFFGPKNTILWFLKRHESPYSWRDHRGTARQVEWSSLGEYAIVEPR